MVSIGLSASISHENCTAWLHEVLLAMLMEQHTVLFLYQLAQARPHNVLHFPCFAGYLKLYQLQKPQISDYDCILVDEAQDLTPGDSCTFFFPILDPSSGFLSISYYIRGILL